MASITPAWKNNWHKPPQPALWRSFVALIALALSPLAVADGFTVNALQTSLREGVYQLDADLELQFSDEALRALSNGVPLTLRLQIDIERVRRWWFDAEVASLEQRYSLQYHALSHQYLIRNLNSGAFYSFPHYSNAVEALGTLRGLPLLDSQLIEEQGEYRLVMQVALDIEALPSPLRPVAYLTPAWHLRSDWYTWPLKH